MNHKILHEHVFWPKSECSRFLVVFGIRIWIWDWIFRFFTHTKYGGKVCQHDYRKSYGLIYRKFSVTDSFTLTES